MSGTISALRRALRGVVLGPPLAIVVLATTAGPIPATTVERLSLDQVAREADRIVHASVVDVTSGRDGSGIPATWITLTVIRAIKGAAASTLIIKQYGVAEPLADGTIARVAPRYAIGEEVVLFLHADSRLGFTSPVGLAQGLYRVSHAAGGATVRSDVPGSGPRDLDEFLAEVARFAAGAP